MRPAGAAAFFSLDGRQEIKQTTGGTCWETTGKTAENGVVGIPGSAPGGLLQLTNRGSSLYLRAGGGVEQNSATAAGAQTLALHNSIVLPPAKVRPAPGTAFQWCLPPARALRHRSAPRLPTSFCFARRTASASTATDRVARCRCSGAASPVQVGFRRTQSLPNLKAICTSRCSRPALQERCILFSDQTNTATGGIIFDTLSPGNDNRVTFRTGGNLDRMQLTSDGRLLLDPVGNPNVALLCRLYVRLLRHFDAALVLDTSASRTSCDGRGSLFRVFQQRADQLLPSPARQYGRSQ